MARKPLTRSQSALIKTPRSELRAMTAAEKAKRGLSAKGEYLIAKGKRFSKLSAFVTRTLYQDRQRGVSHSTAAKQFQTGERNYKSAASEAAAARTRLLRRQRSEALGRLKTLTRVRRPPNSIRREWHYEAISERDRASYPEWRAAYLKWRKGYPDVNDALANRGPPPLEDWQFYVMSDIALEIDDREIIDVRGGSMDVQAFA
jgi:hypothetical protein